MEFTKQKAVVGILIIYLFNYLSSVIWWLKIILPNLSFSLYVYVVVMGRSQRTIERKEVSLFSLPASSEDVF